MDGRAPNDLYGELVASTPVRQPSAEQLRLCLMAAEKVRLDKNHGLTVLGNRYWSESLAKLEHRGPYTVRYDPEHLRDPVAVYEGPLFVCEAPIWSRTGFRDMAAAKDHQREKSAFKRALRQQAQSATAMERARQSWEHEPVSTPDAAANSAATPTPTPKVVRLVRPKVAIPTPRSTLPSTADLDQEMRDFRAKRDKVMAERVQERKRAAGGS